MLFSASTAALAFAFDHLLNVTYALVYGIGELVLHTSNGVQYCSHFCPPTVQCMCSLLRPLLP